MSPRSNLFITPLVPNNLHGGSANSTNLHYTALMDQLEELRKRNQELYKILNNINEIFFKLSLTGEVIEMHTSTSSKEDVNDTGLKGKTIFDFLHPDERDTISSLILEGIRHNKTIKDIKHRFCNRDGEWRWLNTSGEAVYNKAGEPEYIIGISYDITRQLEQEQKLLESEARYRQLFINHPLPLLVFDRETLQILEANKAASLQYGYNEEELLALSDITCTCAPESVSALHEKLNRFAHNKEETILRGTSDHKKKDGGLFFSETTYHPIDFQGRKAWVVCVNDVSEKKKAQDALQESELRYRIFIEQSNQAIFRYESSVPIPINLPAEEQVNRFLEYGYLAECNDLVAQQYRKEKSEQIIGLRLRDALSANDGINHQTLLQFVRAGYRVRNLKTTVSDKEGNKSVISNNLIGIIENDCLVRVWGTAQNITSQLKREKQRHHLAQIVETVTDSIYSCDLTLTILSWNKAAEELYGFSAREAIGKKLLDLIDVYYEAGSQQKVIDHVLETGVWRGEASFYRQIDDKNITLLSSFSLLKDEQGEPTAFIVTEKDISERKEIQSIIEESERRFRTMADSAPAMIWTTDKLDQSVYYNQGWLQFTGKTLEEEIKEKWENKVHPQDLAKALKNYNKAVERKKEFTLEYRLRKYDGSYEWVIDRGTPRFLEDGTFLGYIGVCFNIQDRKEAEEELRISNEKYNLINKATNEAIWDADLVNDISKWGIGYKRLFGYNLKYLNVDTDFWLSRIHPEDRKRVAEVFLNFEHHKNNILEAEYRFMKADGSYALVKDIAYVVRDTSGKAIRMVGSKKDITRQRELEQQLLQSEINKQVLISQATLAGQEKEKEAISRELHDNMNQIISSAKLFLEVARSNPAEGVDLISKAIDNLNLVIQENRKLSRSLASPTLETGIIDAIQELIEDINLTGKVKIEFNTMGNFSEQLINKDIQLNLYRITQEQINNILKYAKANHVTIDLANQKNKIMLCISDDGIGFNPREKRKGIGITNIMNRATLLKGTAEIESAPGKGCTINIVIPI